MKHENPGIHPVAPDPSEVWVIFDMDGTVWDTLDSVTDSWRVALAELGEAEIDVSRERLMSMMGRPATFFRDELLSHLPFEQADAVFSYCIRRENEWIDENGAYLYPGVEACFRALKEDGYRIAIVSNCQAGYIDVFLHHYGYEHYIDVFLCYGDTGLVKTDNLLLLKERYQIRHCYYVGDTDGDLASCREADVPFIWASYGFGTVEDPVPRIDCLTELPGLIRQLTHREQ